MNLYSLVAGDRVRIVRAFRDFDRVEHLPGEVLTLEAHDLFPHDEGHTFRFVGGTVIRLAGVVPSDEEVLLNANDAWVVRSS
jgi:hypothetical protein